MVVQDLFYGWMHRYDRRFLGLELNALSNRQRNCRKEKKRNHFRVIRKREVPVLVVGFVLVGSILCRDKVCLEYSRPIRILNQYRYSNLS